MNISAVKKEHGFSILEVLVSVAIFALIILVISSFVFWMRHSNTKTKADADTLETARTLLDTMAYEIKGATSVYVPTTTASQLSLKTTRYLPAGETETYIDFFLCGTGLCIKKEGQAPVALNPDSVQISSLSFARAVNGATTSVKISLTVAYKNPNNELSSSSSVTLQSTVALRSY